MIVAVSRAANRLLFLALLGLMPSESYANSVLETLNECPGYFSSSPGSWAFRYCEIRNRYLDLIVMGRASEADISAGAKIENERHRCFQRARAQAEWGLHSLEMRKSLANLRKETLPVLKADLGEEAGTKEFKHRVKSFLAAYDQALDPLKSCNQEAVQAYMTRIPVLSK